MSMKVLPKMEVQGVCVHACVLVSLCPCDFFLNFKIKSKVGHRHAEVDSLQVLSPRQQLQLETEEGTEGAVSPPTLSA